MAGIVACSTGMTGACVTAHDCCTPPSQPCATPFNTLCPSLSGHAVAVTLPTLTGNNWVGDWHAAAINAAGPVFTLPINDYTVFGAHWVVVLYSASVGINISLGISCENDIYIVTAQILTSDNLGDHTSAAYRLPLGGSCTTFGPLNQTGGGLPGIDYPATLTFTVV